jgi:hypothetical protein
VTRSIKEEGTTESCLIATLMKHTIAFINSFYTESIWSEKACQVLSVKVTLVQGITVRINSFFKNGNVEVGEAHGQHNLLIYSWRTWSQMGNLEHCCFSGYLVLRPLPQFLRAFSQGQMLNHTGTVPLLVLFTGVHTLHIFRFYFFLIPYLLSGSNEYLLIPWILFISTPVF